MVVLGITLYFSIFSTPTIQKDIRSQYLKAGDFELLLDEHVFQLNQLKGQPLILYFGYTSCPDVCPVGLALIRDALNSSEKFSTIPALFITLDPGRDTAERLREYVSFFHKNIIPLRGTLEQVKSVIEAYGGFFRHSKKNNEASETDYLVDHSAYYYLLNKNGELVRVFDHSISSADLAKTLMSLL
jgi:protein SCO1/2